MNPRDTQHKQIKIALGDSGRMEEIVDMHTDKPRLPPGHRAELLEIGFRFLTLFSALASHYARIVPARRVFNLTIKGHYLAHTILQSQWLHPKFGWCYSGEDFMQQSKRLMARCTAGNSAQKASLKFSTIYRIGLHCILERSK